MTYVFFTFSLQTSHVLICVCNMFSFLYPVNSSYNCVKKVKLRRIATQYFFWNNLIAKTGAVEVFRLKFLTDPFTLG